jgi:hypothetical protein
MTARSRRSIVLALVTLATAALVAQQPNGRAEAGFVIVGHVVDPHQLRPKAATLLVGHQEGNSYSSEPVEVAADGSFRTGRLAPGTYVLELVRDASSPGAGGGTIGFAIVPVAAADVSGVRLEVRRDSTLTGRFRLESDNPRAEPPRQIIALAFLALDGASIATHSQPEPGPADTFVLRNVFGPRVLRFGYRLAPDSPWWPSRVLLDGTDVTNVPTDFSEHPDGKLEVVFTQHPARLAGIVTDADGRPVDEPWVMVTGTDAASWQPWATTSEVVRGNATGRYAIVVPPGKYRVNAVPGSAFASRTAARDGMSRIAFGGVTVAVKARETTRVDVTMQER